MNENNLELDYEESLKYAKENNKKIIWLGMEPLDYQCGRKTHTLQRWDISPPQSI